MTNDEALRVVGYLLEHHGTQGAWARNAAGDALPSVASKDAVCWCLSGALNLVVHRLAPVLAENLHDSAKRRLFPVAIKHEVTLYTLWDRKGPEWRAWAVERLKTAGLQA